MRKLLAFSALCLLSFFLSAAPALAQSGKKGSKNVKSQQGAAAEGDYTETVDNGAIKWRSLVWNFGKVDYGSNVRHEFRFKNTGGRPMTIVSVKAGCGCTTVGYTQEMIPSGGTGFVAARYDSSIVGAFNKTITVNFGSETYILHVKGEVVQPSGSMP